MAGGQEEVEAPEAAGGRSKRTRRPTAALLAMQEDEAAAAQASAPQPPVASVPEDGKQQRRAPAEDGLPGKSKYAYVLWGTYFKPGSRGWFGKIHPKAAKGKRPKHPRLLTARYYTEEEAARAVDRCEGRGRAGCWPHSFPRRRSTSLACPILHARPQVPVQGARPRGVQLPRHARAGGGAGRPHGGADPGAVQVSHRRRAARS